MNHVYVVSFLLVMIFGQLHAQSPKDIFAKNKEVILSKNVSQYDSFVFAVGKIKSASSTQVIGIEKAKTDAYGHLHEIIADRVSWPKQISTTLRTDIWNEYSKLFQQQISVQKGVEVFRDRNDEDCYRVVLAFPSEEMVPAVIPKFESIRSALLDYANLKKGVLQISVCMELSDRITDDLLCVFALKTGNESGSNVEALILGKRVSQFDCLPSTTAFSKLSVEELLVLLNKSPFHPEICFFVAQKLEFMERSQAAQIFYNRGALYSIVSPVYAKKCQKNIKIPLPCSILQQSANNEQFPSYYRKAVFTLPGLKFLSSYSGRLPVGYVKAQQDANFNRGQEAYSKSQLENAYILFCKSAAENPSFDAFNMAGNCGRRINKIDESIALLNHAASIDPSKPHPWIHLAWIFKQVNKEELVMFCLGKTQGLMLDDWSSDQIKQIKIYRTTTKVD